VPCWQPRPQTHLEETPLLHEILPFYPLRLVWGLVWRGIAVEARRATAMKSGSYVLTIPFALSCFVKNDRWIATVARAATVCVLLWRRRSCARVRVGAAHAGAPVRARAKRAASVRLHSPIGTLPLSRVNLTL